MALTIAAAALAAAAAFALLRPRSSRR
jgi:hypothetical protein